MLKEFKVLSLKGSSSDLAVGVVIGGAFSKITTSLVEDILIPWLAYFLAESIFSSWKVVLKLQTRKPSRSSHEICCSFVQISVNFLIVWVIFLVIKAANKAGLTEKKFEWINRKDFDFSTKSVKAYLVKRFLVILQRQKSFMQKDLTLIQNEYFDGETILVVWYKNKMN